MKEKKTEKKMTLALFKKICTPLMLINDNVYTFISGILLSLSTGIITTFCIEKIPFKDSWHMYVSSIMYTIAGGMLIYITSRVSACQKYISEKNIAAKARQGIIYDCEYERGSFWVTFFITLCIFLVAGTAFLFLNYFF